MTRLNFVLLLALIVSCLFLVSQSYESRRLFAEWQRELAQARELEGDHDRLLIERRAQATNLRVEKVARERLRMINGSVISTQVVQAPLAAAEPASAALDAPRAPVLARTGAPR